MQVSDLQASAVINGTWAIADVTAADRMSPGAGRSVAGGAASPAPAIFRGGLTPAALRRVRDYVDRHLEENIPLQTLAGIAGLSKFHFARAFKASQQMTPLCYVLRQRVARAQQLLAETNRPIADIAIAAGFSDQSHFARRFRDHTGVTPGQFRRGAMGGQERGQELCGRVVYLGPGRRRSSPPACPVGETAPPRIDDPSLLLRELTHRVCNEYSAAIAALSLICARTSNAEAKLALRAAEDRLHAYAAIHRAMQMPAGAQRIDLSRHLDNLCQVMSRSLLADRGIRLLLVEKRVELEPECCWRVGLIVSELVTNACKHAFIAGEGAIRVELSRQDGQVCCRVSDNGRATATPRRGRGTEIVGALAAMLGGSVSWAFGSAGATVTLKFPDARG